MPRYTNIEEQDDSPRNTERVDTEKVGCFDYIKCFKLEIILLVIMIVALCMYGFVTTIIIATGYNCNCSQGNGASLQSTDIMCHIELNDNVAIYSPMKDTKYVVNFNTTIMQAQYVYYITNASGERCASSYIKNNPVRFNDSLTTTDYKNTGYDRGHLVPNADHGCDTNYIQNIVPQVPNFNRGSWKNSEFYIRHNYNGYLTVKGCEYNDTYIITPTGKKLYVPVGCYYIILDAQPYSFEQINMKIMHIVLDYGYYQNIENSKREKKLPSWMQCTQ